MRTRIESWNWFTSDSGEHKYIYDGSTLRLGISQQRTGFDWNLEVEAPVLLQLPAGAVAPGAQGQLGQGATYYVANRAQNAAMLFPKQAFLRWKLFEKGHSTLKLGRFEFQDGSETTQKDPSMAALKRDRIQQRLLGPFGFTHVMRSFDGVHFVHDKPSINYTLIGAVPTRGVFQVDGWGWVKVAFAYASATGQIRRPSTSAEWRVFGIYYDDRRRIAKADNRRGVARLADLEAVRIATWGAHYLQVTKTRVGAVDVLGEVSAQHGAWGALSHRATMANVEGGFQPQMAEKIALWIRGGYYFGSGDKDPDDGRHGTFFQIMPTARPYAQFPFYNMMNNVDRFAMLSLRLHKRVALKTETHWLRLASARDLWYAGGGVFQPWTFGYQSRDAKGAKGLANLYSGTIEVTVNSHFSIAPYYGYASGRSGVRAIYPRGKDGHLAFLEMNYRF